MALTEAQLASLRQWAAEGNSLSNLQKRLEEEFSIRMTYMDLRFMLDDLDISLSDPKSQAPKEEPKAGDEPGAEEAEEAETELAGGVSVEVDKINRPGVLMSGNVTFSDGVRANWYVDQMGRLGLDMKDKSYRPSEEDLHDFQMELQRAIQSKGY